MIGTHRTQRRLAQHYVRAARRTTLIDRTASLAARTVGFPIVQVNILDDASQYTISQPGEPDVVTIPREHSLCQHVVDSGEIVVADDLQADSRFADLDFVKSGEARSYVGVPLSGRESWTVGTLCVVDSVARHITDEQIDFMREFGTIVEDQLDSLRDLPEMLDDRAIDAADLLVAIERGEITPWYQPIIELSTGRVAGYEALARWRRSSGIVEDPRRFVVLAEDSDLVLDLDLAMVRRAAEDVRSWRRRDSSATVNVNLSTRHLQIADGVQAVHEVIGKVGVPPEAMTLEITESRMLTDEARALEAVTQLRAWGYRVVLDDFGTGWSSLEWLLTLPITGIKIDRVVTNRLGTPSGDSIHRALVALTDDLGLEATIEGVGSAAQRRAVEQLGYRYGQGYVWAAPMPAAKIAASGDFAY